MEEKDIIWNSISNKIKNERRKIVFLASSTLILPVMLLFIYLSPTVYSTTSQPVLITLNDGTFVKLYPNSELKFSNNIFSKNRNAELSGDALFSVSKNNRYPFVVKGEGFDTEVLGTVFKITQRENIQSLYLLEGKVQVSKNSKIVQKLIPNQEITNYKKENIISLKKVAVNKKEAENTPKSEIIKMDNTELQNIIKHLQNIYKIKISYPQNLKHTPITGDLTIGRVERNLRSIAFVLNLKMEKYGQEYILK